MKGDFSRFKFDPKKNYNSVLMQQGRVILDADWNEQADIQKHIRETEAVDVVGRCGAPIDIAGFKVEVAPDGRDLTLSSGRIYVDGILIELDEHIGYFEDVTFHSENEVRLSALNVDDVGLKRGQWVKISVKDDLYHQVLRIEEIDSEGLILTFNEDVDENLRNEATSSGIYIKIFFKIEDQPVADPIFQPIVHPGIGPVVHPAVEPAVEPVLHPIDETIVHPIDESIIHEVAQKTYLAYLDAWDRHITAVEDDDIREKALGGPDTATRVKTEWRAKLVPCVLETLSCREASLKLKDLTDPGDSRLAVRLQPAQKESATDPCSILSGAAYRGLENQLYRVEIHEPGGVGEATFKWSRNNGAIAFAIVDFIEDESEDEGPGIAEYHKVKLKQLGWDQELRIHKDEWVEVLGDETELLGEPGTLARVEDIDEADLILTLTADVAKHAKESNPKVRRWDLKESGLEESELINGLPTETDSEDGGWIELEYGIEVSFKAGDRYRTGDFWLLPARNTGEIEWPHDEKDFVPKFGIQHHNCLLAILRRDQEGMWYLGKDCRKLFPPLTDMVFLSYVGGEGQEGMPGEELPSPLQVRVHRGGRPVEGAEVNFEIVKGNGKIRGDPGDVYLHDQITVTTDNDGIARCLWRFGDDQPEDDLIWIEEVKATLLYPEMEQPPSIQFNANASAATLSYVGGDGQEGMPGIELPAPLQARVFVGGYPLKNAKVKFEILKGNGKIREKPGDVFGSGPITVTTDNDGIARCLWKFGDDQPEVDLIWTEQVEAALITPIQEHSPSIQFNANASAATLSYVGGDGQEGMPGIELPAPLQARVYVGGYPLKNAKVKFEILKGNGKIREKPGDVFGSGPITVTTDNDGIARCLWKFGDDQPEGDLIWTEQVEAALITPIQEHSPSIQFNANASAASLSYVGGDGQEAMPGIELPAPLQARVYVGGYPLKNAKVKFEILKGNGKIREKPEDVYGSGPITVTTDNDGIARCLWKFGDDQPEGDLIWNEQVEAALITPGQEHPPSIQFNANASAASLSYVGGDGQEAMPGMELPAPLMSRVFLGGYPLKKAKVKFEIVKGHGKIKEKPDDDYVDGPIIVATDNDGIATCFWKFGDDQPKDGPIWIEQVKATLQNPGQEHSPSVLFSASASIAGQVAYDPASCQHLSRARTVQAAIDGLCRIIPVETSRVVWVHGNSLQIEIMSEGISVTRESRATLVRGPKGSKALIHFSIPTTAALDESSFTQAGQAFIRLKSSDKDVIRAVSIYDGEEQIFENDEIEAPENWETIQIGSVGKPISTGLGISILIECTGRISQIEFSAAGCQFSAKR